MEFLIIVVLLVLNGIFAMSELAVVSARRVRLQQMIEDGSQNARVALQLAEEPSRFLSTVQIGITLISILLGAFSGASLSDDLADTVAQIEPLARYSDTIGTGLILLITTYLSLVIGELVPKRLAMQNPERIAVFIARPMNVLSRINAPFVRLLTLSTELMLRFLGISSSTQDEVTEAEVIAMIEQGASTGVFDEAEQEMVEGVFRLADMRLSGIMTPRNEVAWIEVEATPAEIRDYVTHQRFSAYPVCKDEIDQVIGIVEAKDLLAQLLAGEAVDLRAAAKAPVFVPESASTAQLLEQLKTSNAQVALIVDEYGGIQGLTTITDVIAEIVGEIDDEAPEYVQREDGSWLFDGAISIHKLITLLPNFSLPVNEDGIYATLGGFIMTRLGKVPTAADHFDWQGMRFEVVDMDGNVIDKVLVSPNNAPKKL